MHARLTINNTNLLPPFTQLPLDIHLTMYRQVEVVIWTHATGGLTLSDFVLAKALESIKVDYSPKWLENHPEFAGNQK